jgi:hypothetical protein
MKILSVEPRDIHVLFEMNITQVNYLINFLSNSVVSVDGKDPDMVAADQYVRDVFFKQLNELSMEVEHGSGRNSQAGELSG